MVINITIAPEVNSVDVVVVETKIDHKVFKPRILAHLLIMAITHGFSFVATNTMISKRISIKR